MCTVHAYKEVDSRGRLLSAEFTELGLNKTCGEIPVHCEDCHHVLRPPNLKLLVLGIGFILVSFILLFTVGGLRSLVVGVLGIGMTGLGIYLYKVRSERLNESRPNVPLLPRFNRIQIREIVHGRINLDSNEEYCVTVSSAVGVLSITSNFGKTEQDQLQQYLKKYHLPENQDVRFSAGFVALHSASGIDFINHPSRANNTTFELTGRSKRVFTDVRTYGSEEWPKSRRYNLLGRVKDKPLPIRIVPSLIQEAGRKALDLEIQWIRHIPHLKRLTIHRIDLISLQVPITWGQIQEAGGGIPGSLNTLDDGEVARTISWHSITITDVDRKNHHRTFSISFEDPIDVSNRILGKLVVTFKGTLSDIEGVDVFYPVGSRQEVEQADMSTQFFVDFELSLAGLRYQDMRVVPDLEKDKERSRPVNIGGLTPDYKTVIALTNALSEDFYVKSIIEHPPRIGEQANLVNRYWDITGRQYQGVYPIDFHIVLSGEVIKGADPREHSGTTTVDLSVHGAYANDEMENQIKNLWEKLNYLIRTTLEQQRNSKPLIHNDGRQLSSPASSENLPSKSSGEGGIERKTKLRKRVDQLFDLLLAGRISEETFLTLKSETERELQSL